MGKNKGMCDALTWFAVPHRNDFTFRFLGWRFGHRAKQLSSSHFVRCRALLPVLMQLHLLYFYFKTAPYKSVFLNASNLLDHYYSWAPLYFLILQPGIYWMFGVTIAVKTRISRSQFLLARASGLLKTEAWYSTVPKIIKIDRQYIPDPREATCVICGLVITVFK